MNNLQQEIIIKAFREKFVVYSDKLNDYRLLNVPISQFESFLKESLEAVQVKSYRKGQIDLFNRLWDAVNKSQNNQEALLFLFQELNKVRDELKEEKKR